MVSKLAAPGIDRESVDDCTDVEKITRAPLACLFTFHDGAILGHLLTDGPEFLTNDRHRRIDSQCVVIKQDPLLTTAVLVETDVDLKFGAAPGWANCQCVSTNQFELTLELAMLQARDELELDRIPAPEGLHVVRDSRRLEFDTNVKRDQRDFCE